MLKKRVLLDLIEIYRPSRIMLHNLVYLFTYKYGLTPCFRDCDWRLTYTGMYCGEIENLLDDLIEEGLVRVCLDSSLSTGECTGAGSPYPNVISEAMRIHNARRNNTG
ncbi:MAG: hypothetical protein GXO43_06420 [Crenarchaeota archaeon]|nr:hypothetical protein [Thermoproteota archaeon]